MKNLSELFPFVLLFGLCSCSSNDSLTNSSFEEIKVESKYFDEFMGDYVEFIESLGEQQKEIITNYLSTEEQKSSSGARLDQVNCECGSGQSSCSAEGTFSACCICWDSSSETGACGVYFGVASCRNEAKEPKILGKATLKSQWITFQLKKFKESLAFLRTKGIDTHSIQFSLNELTKQAVFD